MGQKSQVCSIWRKQLKPRNIWGHKLFMNALQWAVLFSIVSRRFGAWEVGRASRAGAWSLLQPGAWSAGPRCSLLLHGPQASPIVLHRQDPNLHLQAFVWLPPPGLWWGQPHHLLSTSRTGGRGGDPLSLGVTGIPVPWDATVLGHQGSSFLPITDSLGDPGVFLNLPSFQFACL